MSTTPAGTQSRFESDPAVPILELTRPTLPDGYRTRHRPDRSGAGAQATSHIPDIRTGAPLAPPGEKRCVPCQRLSSTTTPVSEPILPKSALIVHAISPGAVCRFGYPECVRVPGGDKAVSRKWSRWGRTSYSFVTKNISRIVHYTIPAALSDTTGECHDDDAIVTIETIYTPTAPPSWSRGRNDFQWLLWPSSFAVGVKTNPPSPI